MKKSFSITAPWRDKVPVPVYDEQPGYLELYWKAWELAHDHLTDIPGMPQTPYMDEAFCDTEIWIWDTCFMSLFCKYAPDVFPGVETLNNFYKVLYDGASLPVIATKNAPAWTGFKLGQQVQIKIHISDNPPLFAWAEYENAMMTGDLDHVKELLFQKRYLQSHFDWIESLTGPVTPQNVRNVSYLVNDGNGYFWEGGRSGMDNTPRGRTGAKAEADRPNNPRLYWIDAIAQQGLSALCISKLAELCGDHKMSTEWLRRYDEKKQLVNEYYWDAGDSLYYDLDCDTMKPLKVMTPASYWPLTALMATEEQAAKTARHVENPEELGGAVPLLSLARNDADFNAEDGEYWRGALWLPTAYASLKGLSNYGLRELVHTSALKILRHMYETYKSYEPHTIWECYSPNKPLPAKGCGSDRVTVRKDFCGWSALGPISIFLEYVIGLHTVNAFEKLVKWSVPAKRAGRIGVRNFRFGGITADLVCEGEVCTVDSTGAFTLLVNGESFKVKPGKNSFVVKR